MIRPQSSSRPSSISTSSQPFPHDIGTRNPNKSLKNQTTDADIAKKAAPKTSSLVWSWPIKGSLIGRFSSAKSINKGVDIAAKFGESVRAAADGEVVYAGSGLRGYGKLLIIKHPATYLSAYAHNSRLLVREGDRVHRGQIIAEAGDTESSVIKLHFEIRRNGVPVDPLVLLPPMHAR
jgi:lipoprotein NlpD